MLPERFRIFQKHFLDKEKSGASIINNNGENLTSMVYERFNLEFFILVLALYSHCVDKKYNTSFFQTTRFKQGKNMAFEETTGYR